MTAAKGTALQMPLMRVARAGPTATLLKTGPNAGRILIVGGSGRVVDLGSKEIEPNPGLYRALRSSNQQLCLRSKHARRP